MRSFRCCMECCRQVNPAVGRRSVVRDLPWHVESCRDTCRILLGRFLQSLLPDSSASWISDRSCSAALLTALRAVSAVSRPFDGPMKIAPPGLPELGSFGWYIG